MGLMVLLAPRSLCLCPVSHPPCKMMRKGKSQMVCLFLDSDVVRLPPLIFSLTCHREHRGTTRHHWALSTMIQATFYISLSHLQTSCNNTAGKLDLFSPDIRLFRTSLKMPWLESAYTDRRPWRSTVMKTVRDGRRSRWLLWSWSVARKRVGWRQIELLFRAPIESGTLGIPREGGGEALRVFSTIPFGIKTPLPGTRQKCMLRYIS